jgi:hypothetical protein
VEYVKKEDKRGRRGQENEVDKEGNARNIKNG